MIMKKLCIISFLFLSIFLSSNNAKATTEYNPLGLTNIGSEVPFKVNSNRNSYYNMEDGYIYAYGSNLQGNFGTGDAVSLINPEKLGNGLEELRYARDWSLGIDFSCVIDNEGDLWVAANQGIQTSKYVFTKVTDTDASRLLKVEAAYGRAYMINEDGILFYGNQNNYTEVVNNSGLSIIDFCTVGSTSSTTNDDAYAIMSDGSLFFSDNGGTLKDTSIRNIKTIDGDAKSEEIIVTTNSGELYQGSSTSLQLVTLPDINDAKIIRVAQGTNYEGILTSDGQVYLRGVNTNGKFGNGIANATYNTWQLGESNVSYFDIGYTHSLYLKVDGKVYGAGINNYGQLGTGATGIDESTAVESNVVNDSGVVLPEAPKEHSELPDITPTIISNDTEVNSINFGNTYHLKPNEVDLDNELYDDYDVKVIIRGTEECSFNVTSNNDLINVSNYPIGVGSYKIKYQLVYSVSGKVVSESKEAEVVISTTSVELVATDKLNQYLTYINEDNSVEDVKNNIINGIKSGIYLEEFSLYELKNNSLVLLSVSELEGINVSITNQSDVYTVTITISQYGYSFNSIVKQFEFITNKTLGDDCVTFNNTSNQILFGTQYSLVINNPNNYNILFRIESDNFNSTFYLDEISSNYFKATGEYTIYTSVVEDINGVEVRYDETKSILIINKIDLEIKSNSEEFTLVSSDDLSSGIESYIKENVFLYQGDTLFNDYKIISNNELQNSNYVFSYTLNNVSENVYTVTVYLEDSNYNTSNITLDLSTYIIDDEVDDNEGDDNEGDDGQKTDSGFNYTFIILTVGVVALAVFVRIKMKNR